MHARSAGRARRRGARRPGRARDHLWPRSATASSSSRSSTRRRPSGTAVAARYGVPHARGARSPRRWAGPGRRRRRRAGPGAPGHLPRGPGRRPARVLREAARLTRLDGCASHDRRPRRPRPAVRLHEAPRPGRRAARRTAAPTAPAEVVYLSVEVNDPDQLPFVDHLGLVAGTTSRRTLVARTRAAGTQAVADTLGRAGRRRRGPRLRGVPQRAGARRQPRPPPARSPRHTGRRCRSRTPPTWTPGAACASAWALPDGARAHLTHLNLPGVADYTERVTVYCRDRILELTFPSPVPAPPPDAAGGEAVRRRRLRPS